MNTAKSMLRESKKTITQFELTKNIVTNLKQFDLTPSAKLVLILLTTHFNPENGSVVFPSMPFISETLGLGLTAVKQSINDLIKQGLIIKSKRDKVNGNHNKYLLTLKVQNTTSERTENDFFKPSESDRFMITNKKKQIKEQTSDLKNTVSIEDFNRLKQYASNKGAKNLAAYANALIKNGSCAEILNNLKQAENARLSAQRQIEATKQLIQNYRNNSTPYQPIPEEAKRKAEELIAKLKNRKN